MESQLRKSILFDVLDGIPPSGNESKAVMNYRNDIEQSHSTLEEEAMRLGISRDVTEFTEDFRQMSRQSPTEVELLEITFEVFGVSINVQLKARTKKANKELKNKKRINSPVLEQTFKNSAAFRSSFPAKPIEILNNYY